MVDPRDGNKEELFRLYIWHQNINQILRNWKSDPCPALDPGPQLCFGHSCRLNLCYWPLPGSLALRQTSHLFNLTWQVLCSVTHDAFPGTPGFHLEPNSQILVPRLKFWGSCLTPCHICLELVGGCQTQDCLFSTSLWQAKPFWHLLSMWCVLGMVLQQGCSCFLSRLLDHPLSPLQVWDPMFSYSHAGLLGDAWLKGHYLLLCLEASSRREGKANHPLKFISLSRMVTAGWVGHRELAGQSPHSSKLPPVQEIRMELLEARLKVDEKP